MFSASCELTTVDKHMHVRSNIHFQYCNLIIHCTILFLTKIKKLGAPFYVITLNINSFIFNLRILSYTVEVMTLTIFFFKVAAPTKPILHVGVSLDGAIFVVHCLFGVSKRFTL